MARVFISHASEDAPLAWDVQQWLVDDGHETFLDRDLQSGIRVGDEWERRLYERLRWADAMVCVLTRAYLASNWCTAEVGIARSQGTRLLPVQGQPGLSHPLLGSVQYVDLAAGAPAVRSGLRAALRIVDAVGGIGWPDEREPYPGLRPLTDQEHRVFFGRGREVEDLASLLRSPAHQAESALLLVVGPSGCGKSSLVRAGLLPVIGAEQDWWTVPPLLPGAEPVAALVRELAGAARAVGLGWTIASTGRRLLDRGLSDIADELLLAVPGQRRRHLLVVVDQYEELITQASTVERARFAEILRPALDGPATVVATLRPEFLDQLLLEPALASMPTRAYPVRPLRPESLRDVIEGPARVAGIDIDDDLVTRLVADTEGGEALPLLAYTLAQLARGVGRGGKLLMARYEELGGVQGAITRQADAALAEAEQIGGRDGNAVIKELLRLVTVDEQGRPTRTRVSRGELPAPVVAEFEPFVARRLLTTDAGNGNGSAVLGVAHEAFLSAWSPLAAAIDDAAAALRARRQIEQAAAAWSASGREQVRLWERGQLASALSDTGARLRHVPVAHGSTGAADGEAAEDRPGWRLRMGRRVLVADRVDLSWTAREFLRLSIRQDRFRRRRATTVLASLLVAAVVAAVAAFLVQREATYQQRVATARQLAATAVSNEDTHLDLAQLLAVEGYRRHPNAQTRAALFSAVTASPQLVRYLHASAPVSALTVSRDGRFLVVGTESGGVLRWDASDAGQPREVGELADPVLSVATSADGTLIAATDGRSLVTWEAGPHNDSPSRDLPRIDDPQAVGLSPSGRWLAVAGRDRSGRTDAALTLVDLQERVTSTVPLAVSPSDLLLPDEDHLVAVSLGYGVWQRMTLTPPVSTTLSADALTGAHLYAAGISPDGSHYTWTNAATEVPVWRTETPADPDNPDLVATAPGRFPEALAVSSDGSRVATADTGSIYVSTTGSSSAAPEQIGILTGNSSIDRLLFMGENGDSLVSASADVLAIWDLSQSSRIGKAARTSVPAVCNACPGPNVRVSPDGRAVAISQYDDATITVQASPLASSSRPQSGRFLSVVNSPESFSLIHWSEDSSSLLVRVPPLVTVEVRVGGPEGEVVETARAPAGNEEVTLRPLGPGDPAIVLRAVGGRAPDRTEAALLHAGEELDAALHARDDDASQLAVPSLDSAMSTAATVISTVNSEGEFESEVWVLDLDTGRMDVLPLRDAVDVAFARDRLLVSRGSGTLEIRDLSGRHTRAVVPGGPRDIAALTAAVDSDLAARLRLDGTVVLVDTAGGAVLGSVGTPSQVTYGQAPGLAFTPDGRDLFVAAPLPHEENAPDAGELRQYLTTEGAWVDRACRTAGRSLTAAEWTQVVNESVPTDLACDRAS